MTPTGCARGEVLPFSGSRKPGEQRHQKGLRLRGANNKRSGCIYMILSMDCGDINLAGWFGWEMFMLGLIFSISEGRFAF